MMRAVWPGFRRNDTSPEAAWAALTRAALTGVSTDELLEQAARGLLELGRADRAGVWLVRDREMETLNGTVVDALFSPVPPTWCRARLASPALGMLLHSREPLIAESNRFAEAADLEALTDLHTVVWLPLRTSERLWGVAWVGYRRPAEPPKPQILHLYAEQLVVVLSERASKEELRRLQAAAAALGEIVQMVFSGTSQEEIFVRITQTAVANTPAYWAALARLDEAALHLISYHGPPEFSAPIRHPELLAEARRAWVNRSAVLAKLSGRAVPRSVAESGTVLLLPVPMPWAIPCLLLAGFEVESPEEAARSYLLVLAQLVALVAHAEPAESTSADAAGLPKTGERTEETVQADGVAVVDVVSEGAPRNAARTALATRLEAELRSVLDSVHAGILLADRSGQIRYVNHRFVQLLGVNPLQQPELCHLDALAAAVQDRFRNPEEFADRWRQRRRERDEFSVDELEMVRPARKIIERFARPVLDRTGRCLGWLEVYRDLTQQRLIQAQLVQTEKMAALGQLVSGIAHELNNPLTSIMGYAQLLLSRRLNEDRVADAEKIYQEAERARRLVKNLLLFAREAKPERRLVDLNEIVERTLALRSYELKVKNIQVSLELDPELPRTLADAHQLQQVILNLVVNAEQALQMARGSGNIWIRTRRAPGTRIALEVADDGPGIPPDVISRIFDPFFTTKPPGLGTGLGLSIAYGIVQEHGGEITVDSPPGQGATFVVELPVVTATPQSPRVESPVRPECRVLPGRRVLVVEDEPTIAQLIVDVLTEQGHQVEAVLDSREGLHRVSQQDYDLVICDLRMPRLDGHAFYEALVRSGSPVRNRLFFITGDTLAPRTIEFLKTHRIPYLAKPFLVEELTLAVHRLLASSPAIRATDPSVKAATVPARKP